MVLTLLCAANSGLRTSTKASSPVLLDLAARLLPLQGRNDTVGNLSGCTMKTHVPHHIRVIWIQKIPHHSWQDKYACIKITGVGGWVGFGVGFGGSKSVMVGLCWVCMSIGETSTYLRVPSKSTSIWNQNCLRKILNRVYMSVSTVALKKGSDSALLVANLQGLLCHRPRALKQCLRQKGREMQLSFDWSRPTHS